MLSQTVTTGRKEVKRARPAAARRSHVRQLGGNNNTSKRSVPRDGKHSLQLLPSESDDSLRNLNVRFHRRVKSDTFGTNSTSNTGRISSRYGRSISSPTPSPRATTRLYQLMTTKAQCRIQRRTDPMLSTVAPKVVETRERRRQDEKRSER